MNCPFSVDQKTRAYAHRLFSESALWSRATTNIELDRYARRLDLPGWKGVLSRDRVRTLGRLRTIETYIINLQGYFEGPGTHWVGLIKDGGQILYLDTYGMHPPREIVERYRGYEIRALPVGLTLQTDRDSYCGMLVMYGLYDYWFVTRDWYETLMHLLAARENVF